MLCSKTRTNANSAAVRARVIIFDGVKTALVIPSEKSSSVAIWLWVRCIKFLSCVGRLVNELSHAVVIQFGVAQMLTEYAFGNLPRIGDNRRRPGGVRFLSKAKMAKKDAAGGSYCCVCFTTQLTIVGK